ncbi:hypothetical protein ACK3TF_005903 [Chlorella vulgaris]
MPGVNRWLGAGAEGGKGGPRASQHPRRLQLDQYQDVKQSQWPGCPRSTPGNSDTWVVPGHPNDYDQSGCSYRLGAAISQGYGRAPTTYVTTSADVLLPTTHYQTPRALCGKPPSATRAATGQGTRAATAAAAPNMTSRGRLLQAFTFSSSAATQRPRSSSGSGSMAAHSLDHPRTLLYTRYASASPERQRKQQQHCNHEHMPAPDLLQRLTQLRRLAPATTSAARPARLTAQPPQRVSAQQHFTPAPTSISLHGRGAAAGAGGGYRRWAWEDDSPELQASAAAVAAGPAPGWCYHGEVVAAAHLDTAGVSLVVGSGGTSGDSGGELNVSVTGCGGCASCSSRPASRAGGAGEQHSVVVTLHSPHVHHLGCDELAGTAGWHGSEEAQDSGAAAWPAWGNTSSKRPAFRPPGPLQHKFGNKPRPRSAPGPTEGAAERTPRASLRQCGCPHTFGASTAGAPGFRDTCSNCREGSGSSSPRKQLRWEDEQAPAAPARQLTRPHSAHHAPGPRQPCSAALHSTHSSSSYAAPTSSSIADPQLPKNCAAAGCMPSRPGSARASSGGSCNGCCYSAGIGGGGDSVDVAVGGTEVRVTFSPSARGGCGRTQQEPDSVEVVLPGCHTQASTAAARHTSAVCTAAAPDATASGAAVPALGGSRQQVSCAPIASNRPTAATPGAPAGGSSYSFSAKVVGAGAAAPSAGAGDNTRFFGSSSSRRAASHACLSESVSMSLQQQAQAARGGRQVQVGVEIVVSPSAVPTLHGCQAGAAADLALLSGEMRRRERSFGQLLAELERISAKCAKLTSRVAGTSTASSSPPPGAAGNRSAGVAVATPPPGRVPAHPCPPGGCTAEHAQQPQQGQQLHQTRPEHSTHRFSADTSDCTAGGRAGGSASADGSSNGVSTRGVQGGAGAGEDWTWEGLQAFEETIRAQQRKLVEQGVLPPRYA